MYIKTYEANWAILYYVLSEYHVILIFVCFQLIKLLTTSKLYLNK